MIIGVPKEIKDSEYRVAVVPAGARALVRDGHRVLVEKGAGGGSSISDGEFASAGAEMVSSAAAAFGADVVIKVKEPRPEEYQHFREGMILFTFLHLATDEALALSLVKNRVTSIAYETVEVPGGGMPILRPMSEVAGRLSVQIGAHYLLRPYGGRGVLLAGVPGVAHGKVLVLGAGTVGENAVRVAVGLGAETTVIDKDTAKFRHLEELFDGSVKTLISNPDNIAIEVAGCDILIGAVHSPGARTPTLVSKELVGTMKKGSVIVDVAVDQGGCVETIRPTTHSDPVYEVDGVLHYAVTNIPGAVPRTSTYALTNETLPYLLKLAKYGLSAINMDPSLGSGVNTYRGAVANRAVADTLGMEFKPFK